MCQLPSTVDVFDNKCTLQTAFHAEVFYKLIGLLFFKEGYTVICVGAEINLGIISQDYSICTREITGKILISQYH